MRRPRIDWRAGIRLPPGAWSVASLSRRFSASEKVRTTRGGAVSTRVPGVGEAPTKEACPNAAGAAARRRARASTTAAKEVRPRERGRLNGSDPSSAADARHRALGLDEAGLVD